jgi:hypothetical protein
MTPKQLDDSAFHVAFEVLMLVEQIEFYIDNYGPVFPCSSSTEAEEQALLEASLIHLRLLDEFLGRTRSHRYPADVRACDWPGWSPKTFLSKTLRQEIDVRVAHLSRRRQTNQEWDLPKLGKAACDRLLEFFDSIAPERLPAFAAASEVAEHGRRRFTDELAKYGR